MACIDAGGQLAVFESEAKYNTSIAHLNLDTLRYVVHDQLG